MENALLAGGCFWCIEASFLNRFGIVATSCGYLGPDTNPTYETVCKGSGHYEGVRVAYDEQKISYLQVLEVFWRHIDPLDEGGQFADRGIQYQTAIFPLNPKQKELAQASKEHVASLFSKPVATKILEPLPFTLAEAKHQAYCMQRPTQYSVYASSHQKRLKELWHHVAPFSQVRGEEYLTPLQRRVIFEKGTEPPFDNAYYNLQEEGIYLDILSGEPLFSSEAKYDSKSGWPSFTTPINEEALILHEDLSLEQPRTEVLAKKSGSHLGHVFPDGPPPTFRRYCMNSAALYFVPSYEY